MSPNNCQTIQNICIQGEREGGTKEQRERHRENVGEGILE